MAAGIQVLVPIGTDQGILTNVFIKINSALLFTTGQPTMFNVYAYPSQASFAADPSNILVIKALPSNFIFPALFITAFDNQPSVEAFVYNQFLALVISAVGPGNAIIIP